MHNNDYQMPKNWQSLNAADFTIPALMALLAKQVSPQLRLFTLVKHWCPTGAKYFTRPLPSRRTGWPNSILLTTDAKPQCCMFARQIWTISISLTEAPAPKKHTHHVRTIPPRPFDFLQGSVPAKLPKMIATQGLHCKPLPKCC